MRILLSNDDGILAPEIDRIFEHKTPHDPADLDEARALAEKMDRIRLGLYYRNESNPRYEETRALTRRSTGERIRLLHEEFDRYAV